MTKILKEPCEACREKASSSYLICSSCSGTGFRFVPSGYTQGEVDVVRTLVDALAVQQGVA